LESSRSEKSLLTEGIFDANVDTTMPGSIRVALWREWRAMLDDLRGVGPLWSIVRNGHCVLAVYGDYPQLTFSSDQQVAKACDCESSLSCYLSAWRQAVAFDSGCCFGRTYGLEIENAFGEIFHRVCLAKNADLAPFMEWTQMHQATGLETEEAIEGITTHEQENFWPLSGASRPGTLEVSPNLLRTVLITAAQREIPLIAAVATEGISQVSRIEVLRASEANGWLALSGNQRCLYVESEPRGSLLLEPASSEGEVIWRLSLLDPDGHSLMRVQPAVDGRAAWSHLIWESVLRPSGIKPIL
jgi:putative heme degradation protein